MFNVEHFRPPAALLGQIPNTGIYRDLHRISSVSGCDHTGLCGQKLL